MATWVKCKRSVDDGRIFDRVVNLDHVRTVSLIARDATTYVVAFAPARDGHMSDEYVLFEGSSEEAQVWWTRFLMRPV